MKRIFTHKSFYLLLAGGLITTASLNNCSPTGTCIQINGDPNDLDGLFNSGTQVCPSDDSNNNNNNNGITVPECENCPTPPTPDPNNLDPNCNIPTTCSSVAALEIELGPTNYCEDITAIVSGGPPYNGEFNFTFRALPESCTSTNYIATCSGFVTSSINTENTFASTNINSITFTPNDTNPIPFTLNDPPATPSGGIISVLLQCSISLINSTCQSPVTFASVLEQFNCPIP